MNSLITKILRTGLLIAAGAFGSASTAVALPTDVTVTPPEGERFFVGQKFDLRVEGKGTGPFSATIKIDGISRTFGSGAQNSTVTDGITSPGFGGFNLRGYSNADLGIHNITATFTDASGTVSINSKFKIVNLLAESGDRDRSEDRGEDKRVRNIIIMLGDGMGVAHRTAARLVKFGVTAGEPNGYLAMDQFPGTGMITTHSLNSIVTDSAPGMSSYTTGSHAKNGQEGVYPANMIDPFFYPRVEYLSEYLHRFFGKSLGLVTTADVEDATPAANAVHTGDRNRGTGICDQYLDESDATNTRRFGTGLAVLMGGGRRWFLPAGQFGSSRSSGTDYAALPADLVSAWQLPASAVGAADPNRNLLQDFMNSGFTYADTATSLGSVGSPNKLLGLFGYGNMNVALDKLAKRRNTLLPGTTSFSVDDYHAPDQPMLDEMTDVALRVLNKNRRGFVLMVEGAHIDKQSHLMDADRVIDETIEFDNAVAAARRFADRAGDTLIIVVSDHECAGFSLIGALTGGIDNLKTLPPDNATLDPNIQPARQRVVGVYDAAGFPNYTIAADGYPLTFDVNGKILIGYGANADRYEGWLTKPLPVRDSLLPADIKAELTAKGYPGVPIERSENQFGYYIRGQAVGKDQAVHTASDIPISAYSSSSRAYELFFGIQQNTDVFFKLMRLAAGRNP
jgi:alkaline phosphatase